MEFVTIGCKFHFNSTTPQLPNVIYKAIIFSILFLTCNSTAELPNDEKSTQVSSGQTPPPTRRQLFRKQYDLKAIHIITPNTEAYKDLEKNMGGSAGRGITVNYANVEQWGNNSINDKAIFLIGSIKEHEILRALIPDLPIDYSEQELAITDRKFTSPEAILKISLFPNPGNPNIPIYVLTGNNDENIIAFIKEKYENNWRQLIWSSFGYQVFENNLCALSGFFSEKDWTIDKKLHWDFSSAQKDTLRSKHFNFIQHEQTLNPEQLQELAKNCEAGCRNIEAFFSGTVQQKIDYHIYSNMESKGLMLSNTSHSHIVPDRNEVHAIHAKAFLGNQLQAENKLIIQALTGRSENDWIQNGLSIYHAPKWQRYGYQHWAKKLLTSDNLPSIVELINPESVGFESHIVLGAGQAALVDYLINSLGREKFISQYKNGQLNRADLSKVTKDFHQHILQFTLAPTKFKKKPLPYLKGFNFAHEGYQIYNGYGSNLANASLQKTKSLGTNAIAIVPYSYMENHEAPSPIPIVDFPGSESDESVIHSLQQAKTLGMHTMIKPQLWLGKSWTGFIDMKSPQEWDDFFNHYYRWIRHFALLSEIYEADIFSVGVEFVNATLKNEAVWKHMFEKIRPLYSGQLTYCANWGDEFEKINFWEPLDFIGLNCYYPIGNGSEEQQKALNQNFKAVVQKIENVSRRTNKKVVFTEIGFRSVKAPWKNPHAEADGRAFSEADQAACYQAVFENIQDKDWCKGILWWKWPCYLGHRGPENTSFAPAGKTTEKVIEKWFKHSGE